MSISKRITNYTEIVKSVVKLQTIIKQNVSEDEIFGNHYIVDKDKYDKQFDVLLKSLNKLNDSKTNSKWDQQEYGLFVQFLDQLKNK